MFTILVIVVALIASCIIGVIMGFMSTFFIVPDMSVFLTGFIFSFVMFIISEIISLKNETVENIGVYLNYANIIHALQERMYFNILILLIGVCITLFCVLMWYLDKRRDLKAIRHRMERRKLLAERVGEKNESQY